MVLRTLAFSFFLLSKALLANTTIAATTSATTSATTAHAAAAVSVIETKSAPTSEVSPFGLWQTIDDETKKPKSLVKLYEKDGKMFGQIVKLFRTPAEDQDPLCKECKGDKKNQKIIGMNIVEGMQKDGLEWKHGTIIDPKNGKTYDCKMWIENKELKVRGYVAFFYRTQTWVPQ